MNTIRKQGVLQGAAILTIATLVVKVIGMFYRIPLGNILGAAGMSYFMTAYSIFNPVYALATAGLPVAVSKLVSESAAQGKFREVRRIFRVSFTLFILLGLFGFLIMFVGAGPLTWLINNEPAKLAVMAMAPAVFFCCVLSAYRGYYQGLQNMTPTAVSQVLESLAKLVFGIGFAQYFLQNGLRQYALNGTVYGIAADNAAQAELLALPFAAAGAILGVTLSTVAGAFYLFLRTLIRGDTITTRMLKISSPSRSGREIVNDLFATAIPVCIASVLAHVTTLIDVATIINRLDTAMQRDSVTLISQYHDLFPKELTPDAIPSFLYGAYGYTTSIFNLVPAITVTLGISALPSIASNWALGGKQQAVRQMRAIIKLVAMLAIPAGLGIAVLSEPILALLYPARPQEVAIAAPILRSMGIAAAFVGITTPVSSLFQAVGRADIPVKLMAMGAILKLGANFLLVANPLLNIKAAPIGTVLCYTFILFAGLRMLKQYTGAEKSLLKVLPGPLFCGIICAVSAHTSYELLYRIYPARWICLVSIAIGGFIYLIFVLLLGVVTKNELLLLSGGKKIVKILEKLRLLR